eukprot:CFRG8327T1
MGVNDMDLSRVDESVLDHSFDHFSSAQSALRDETRHAHVFDENGVAVRPMKSPESNLYNTSPQPGRMNSWVANNQPNYDSQMNGHSDSGDEAWSLYETQELKTIALSASQTSETSTMDGDSEDNISMRQYNPTISLVDESIDGYESHFKDYQFNKYAGTNTNAEDLQGQSSPSQPQQSNHSKHAASKTHVPLGARLNYVSKGISDFRALLNKHQKASQVIDRKDNMPAEPDREGVWPSSQYDETDAQLGAEIPVPSRSLSHDTQTKELVQESQNMNDKHRTDRHDEYLEGNPLSTPHTNKQVEKSLSPLQKSEEAFPAIPQFKRNIEELNLPAPLPPQTPLRAQSNSPTNATKKHDDEINEKCTEISKLKHQLIEREKFYQAQIQEAMRGDQYKTATKYQDELESLRNKNEKEVNDLRSRTLSLNHKLHRSTIESNNKIKSLSDELELERTNNEKKVQQLESLLREANATIGLQKTTSSDRDAQNEALRKTNNLLSREVKDLKHRLHEIETSKKAFVARLTEVEGEHADCQDTIEELRGNADALALDKFQLQERVDLLLFESNADRKQKELLNSLFSREKEAIVLQTTRDVEQRIQADCDVLIAERERDLESARTKLANIKSRLRKKEQECSNLIMETNNSRMENETILSRVQTQRTELENSICQLRLELKQSQSQSESTASQLQTSLTQYKEVCKQLDSARAETRKANELLEGTRIDLNTAKAQLKKQRDRLEASRAQTGRANSQLENIRQDNHRIKAKVDELLHTDAQASKSLDHSPHSLETLKKDGPQEKGSLLAYIERMKTEHANELRESQDTYTSVMESLREDLLKTAAHNHSRFKKKLIRERAKMVSLTEGYRRQCKQYMEAVAKDVGRGIPVAALPPLPEQTLLIKKKHGEVSGRHLDRPVVHSNPTADITKGYGKSA